MEDGKDGVKILVVDDDGPVRLTLKAMVNSFGYDCLVAESGQEALSILAENDIDVVLSDIVMPGMDGLELLKQIKTSHMNTDVIIATGFSGKVNYAEVIKAGAMDFIKKPIDLAELEAKLARGFRERALIRSLEQLSLSDGLTQLWNRRAFDQRFPREVERASRQGYQLFLAILDLDNFKEFNDTYGHLEGDHVLQTFAKIAVDCTRANVDMCFRLGGDEFAILLPQTNAEQATEIMKRVLNRYNEYQIGNTSLSIGLVPCRRNIDVPVAEDEEMMKARADQAMYDAKNSGRNRIVCRS